MKIRRKFALSSRLVVVLALIQLGLALVLLHNQGQLAEAQEVQHESWKLSDELRASSDDLTRTARTYVVTGLEDAQLVLATAYEKHARDFDIAWALATVLRDSGDLESARDVLADMRLRFPDDSRVAALSQLLSEPR